MADRRFTPDLLDAIRGRVPLSAVVGRRVTWDKRKSQFARGDHWACCPFHNEKTPSFHVDDRKGFYHCFGCGASGDHFRFLMEKDGMGFSEAVEELAGLAGVPLPEPTPAARAESERRHRLADVAAMAAAFFRMTLAGRAGERARRYAEGRGLAAETMETFAIGAAPDARDALRRHLAAEGVPDETMEAAGMIARPDDGRAPYDRFRDRLVIPIHDARGRVVGFGGRALSPEREPKYLNSPDGPLFDKSRLLFNAHRATGPARERGRVFVVEGYLDAIALHEAGVAEVVASLGTAFTEHHAGALFRMADEPVICFDGDAAGRRAAFRAVDRLLPLVKAGQTFRFAFLPEGEDPDDLIRRGGRSAFEEVAAVARPLVDVIWSRETEGVPLDTPERRAALEARLDAVAQAIEDERVRRAYRDELSDRFFRMVRRPGRGGKGRGPGPPRPERTGTPVPVSPPVSAPPEAPLREVERLLLAVGAEMPELFEVHAERLLALDWARPDHARLAAAAIAAVEAAREEDGAPLAAGDLAAHLSADLAGALPPLPAATDDAGLRPSARATAFAPHLAVLRLAPDPAVLSGIFEHLVQRLELAALERELDREIAATGADCADADEARLMSLSRELRRRLALHAERERELADEIARLRRSRAA